MRKLALACILTAILVPLAGAAEPGVTGIKAFHRHGQTFVTWKDAAEGKEGTKYRYSLYRSDAPITQANLARAERVIQGILNNSCKLLGMDLTEADRLDPKKPTLKLKAGGEPLPLWTGVGVHTVTKDGKGYYAVVVTDLAFKPVGKVVPGKSATTEPVVEKVAPFQPVLQMAAKDRKNGAGKTSGKKGLPMRLALHGSCSSKAWRNKKGDEYLFFAPKWGYRSGQPGIFVVYESKDKIFLAPRDTTTRPSGERALETMWVGYFCKPYWSKDTEPRAYLFTEQRLKWMMDWVVKKYAVDSNRIDAGGQSMGSLGSTVFGLRRPGMFAVFYASTTPGHLHWLMSIDGPKKLWLLSPTTKKVLNKKAARYLKGKTPYLPDGKTEYFDHVNMIEFVKGPPGDLAFFCYVGGRHGGNDSAGYCKWPNQVALAKALTAGHHGFGFGWDNGGHGSARTQFKLLKKYYPAALFARNKSYPAFGNSSIDDDPGPEGPKEGCINVGFVWKGVVDEADKWSAVISNGEAKEDMTADVTPRRCQKFKAKPGEKFKWTNSAGGAGTVTADKFGLVTVEKVKIKQGAETTLTIQR